MKADTTHVDRRAVIKGATLTAAAAAIPAVTIAQPAPAASATISPPLTALVQRWHAIEAARKAEHDAVERELADAGFETLSNALDAINYKAADAQFVAAMEIASFPARSLADIVAKCAFAMTEERDADDVAMATIEGTRADAERLLREVA